MRKFRGRLSRREKILRNNALDRFYAGSAGVEPRFQVPVPETRARRPRDASKVYEKDVLADVLQALRADPRIALVERTQSGLFQDGNRFIRVGTKGKLDITFMTVSGRYGEIECKRPGATPDERQQARIEAIRRNGGIAGFATSAAEALALLPPPT